MIAGEVKQDTAKYTLDQAVSIIAFLAQILDIPIF